MIEVPDDRDYIIKLFILLYFSFIHMCNTEENIYF